MEERQKVQILQSPREGDKLGASVLNKPAEPDFPRTFDKSIDHRPYGSNTSNVGQNDLNENPYVPSALQKSTEVISNNRLASRPMFALAKPPSMSRPQEQKLVGNSSISQPQLPKNQSKSTRNNRIADPFAHVDNRLNDYGTQEVIPKIN